MKPQMRTGKWLAMARGCAGLTQTELARLAGLKSTIVVSLYETGAHAPSLQTWDALEEVLRRYVPLMFVDEEALVSTAAAGVGWEGEDALCRLSYAPTRHGIAFTGIEAIGEEASSLDGSFITVPLSQALMLLSEQKAWCKTVVLGNEAAVDGEEGKKSEGAELKEMREALGISQREISRRLSVSQPSISLLERGLSESPDSLRRYRELLEQLTTESQSESS